MEGIKVEITIRITDKGVDILSGEDKGLHFSASEALMLLDILRNEEQKLRQMAEKVCPMPIRIESSSPKLEKNLNISPRLSGKT